MKLKDFAPHLAGRMLPGLFSAMPFAKKPRFEGDPWATFPHSPTWFWMHTTECGTPDHVGKYTSWLIRAALLNLTPPKPVVGDDRASVGSMRTRQPADAAPQRDLFPEMAS